MYSWLDDATSADDTSLIVTASRRLARELRQIHSDRMLAAGAKSWPTPRIQYLGDWCAALIDNAPETGVRLRLSPNASNVLWERQLRDRQIAELPGFSGVVRQCRQTWQRLHEWRVPLDAVLSRASGPEQRLFAGAASEYQSILARERWVDDATILDCIASAFESGVIAEPSRIYLAGFDSINPAVRRIVDQLESDPEMFAIGL